MPAAAPSETSVLVFTRDLRTRDHPALVAAAGAERTVPLFVLDDEVLGGLHASANRQRFLLDCLEDLRASLRRLGGDLVVRRGDWVREVADVVDACEASTLHLSHDVSAFASDRVGRLRATLASRCAVVEHPGVTVVEPGATAPSGGSHWKVFTPYHRSWLAATWRPVHRVPTSITLPAGVDRGTLPRADDLVDGAVAPDLLRGGEERALHDLRRWTRSRLEHYDELHDDLAADGTSHISAHLHLGSLSPNEIATRLRSRPGGAAFVRQLCWRDFYHQLLAARPEVAHADVRGPGPDWNDDADALEAWTTGRTGFPLVDAAMRQLLAEGFVHNRARMVAASFLTKDLLVDWRLGAAHYMAHLVDGDVANNQLNWQWVAGTGTDTNPHRILNPTVQSQRFDPDGQYIRRYVDELAGVAAPTIHEPDAETRERTGYPAPVVDHREAIAEYRLRRTAAAES